MSKICQERCAWCNSGLSFLCWSLESSPTACAGRRSYRSSSEMVVLVLGTQQGTLSQLVLAALSKAVKEMMSEVTEAALISAMLIFVAINVDYVTSM